MTHSEKHPTFTDIEKVVDQGRGSGGGMSASNERELWIIGHINDCESCRFIAETLENNELLTKQKAATLLEHLIERIEYSNETCNMYRQVLIKNMKQQCFLMVVCIGLMLLSGYLHYLLLEMAKTN